MIGLDANVVIRFLTQDDDIQAALAAKLFGRLTPENRGFISGVVLAEIAWVLSRVYKTSRAAVGAAIGGLLRSSEIKIENSEAAWRALAVFESSSSVEFADALISETARIAGASPIYTFDETAAKRGGMTVLS